MSSSDVPSQQKLSVLTNPMASFDTNARIFVQLSKDNRMKVWNPETNVLQQDLTLPFQLSAKYTCLALSPLDEKEDHSAQYLACGTADGTVIVWDLNKGEIHAELGKSTTQENKGTPIDALAFVNKNTLYAASRKVTTLWDIKTSNKMQTFNFVKRSSAMCSDAEGTLLAVASADSGTRINVYLQQPGKQSTKPALKINAHTAPANQLITFSLPKVENGLRMLSISNDRYINYYNLNLEDKETDPIKVFACEERPIRIDVVPKKKGFDLLCLTEAGNIFIYKVHESEKKGIEIKSTIKVCNAKATKSQKILSAVFDKSSKKYEIIIARGLSTRPHFEKISYKGKADTITLEELDENFLLSNKTVQQDARMEDFENDKETLDSSLANNSSSKIPNMAKTSTHNKAEVINKQQTEHTRKSLQAIIDESEIQDKQARPRTQVALTSAVSQALTSGDSEMLQNCLEESDTTLINDTVAGLPAGQIMGLILSIAKRFEAAGHPRTVAVLLRWINAILRTHTTYLMTHPNAMKTLSPLHSTIHSRVANYNKLASLAGKLELVISQFGDRVQQDTTALNYYREGESATDDIIARYDATKEDEDEADEQNDANGLLLDTDGDFDMGGDDIEMHMGDSDDEEDDTEEYILE